MTFSTFLAIVIVGYALYYSYMIISDLFFKKEAAQLEKIEDEQEVDVSEMTGSFQPQMVSRPGTVSHPSGTESAMVFNPVNTGAIRVEDFFATIEDFTIQGEFSELGQMIAEQWGARIA